MATNWFSNSFAEEVWKTKYAGLYSDIQSYFSSLAGLASMDSKILYGRFYDMLINKKFSPGGRILAACGKPSAKTSYMNCTTHQVEDDSIEAIANAAYMVMRASSRGQGIGVDLSKLRPIDSPVNNAAVTSTGSISFMELINHAGGIIGQEGRRAALLFSLDVSHPDIWRPYDKTLICPKCSGKGCMYCSGKGTLPYDFLHVKKVPGRVENANISVNITNDFMQAVKEDAGWLLYFKGYAGDDPFEIRTMVSAQELFKELAMSAFKSAEPGVLFVDTTRNLSNSDVFGPAWGVVGVNACTEQLLDQEGVCNLGSMNLSAYVKYPFTVQAEFDLDTFKVDVALAIEFLDNILDLEYGKGVSISDRQRNSIRELRRIGLGVMGFADALAMLGIRYKYDDRLVSFVSKVFGAMRDSAYLRSVDLGWDKGAAGVWTSGDVAPKTALDYGFFRTLPSFIKKQVEQHGTRNVTLLSVAPTGSISNFFGVSSGIEPLFALEYTRRHRMNGSYEFTNYVHPAVIAARKAGVDDSIWDTAYEVSPTDHVLIQAEIQKYIDQSISKTTNLPAGSSPHDVEEVYMQAYENGLKGIAVYVDGSRQEQVLYADNKCPVCSDGGNVVGADGCKTCTVCGWSLCT